MTTPGDRTKTPSELRKFGFTIGVAFGLVGGVIWWRGHDVAASVLGLIAALLISGATLLPTVLGPVERAWMAFALAISKVTTPIFMGIVYFAILTPTAVLRRTLGSHPLRHQPRDGSYWFPRDESRQGDLERQF